MDLEVVVMEPQEEVLHQEITEQLVQLILVVEAVELV